MCSVERARADRLCDSPAKVRVETSRNAMEKVVLYYALNCVWAFHLLIAVQGLSALRKKSPFVDESFARN